MAAVPKGKAIVNDTTPMICTIEGIAKKEHVVRSKLTFTVLSVRLMWREPVQTSYTVCLSFGYVAGLYYEGATRNQSWRLLAG